MILKCVKGSEFPASVEGAPELDEAPEDELGVVVVIERTSEARVCNAENRLGRIIDAMVMKAISIARKFSVLGCFGVGECAELTRMVGVSSFGVFRLVAESWRNKRAQTRPTNTTPRSRRASPRVIVKRSTHDLWPTFYGRLLVVKCSNIWRSSWSRPLLAKTVAVWRRLPAPFGLQLRLSKESEQASQWRLLRLGWTSEPCWTCSYQG